MSAAYDRLAELPIRISSYELTAHDREFGEFTRPSTVIHMHGEGQEGIGEDVVYTVLDHIAHRDAGPIHDLTGAGTLGEACELIGGLDLFGARRPTTTRPATTGGGPTSRRRSTSPCARPAWPSGRWSSATPRR